MQIPSKKEEKFALQIAALFAVQIRNRRDRQHCLRLQPSKLETGKDASLIRKDIKGNYMMLGSDFFEKTVLEERPLLIETGKHRKYAISVSSPIISSINNFR